MIKRSYTRILLSAMATLLLTPLLLHAGPYYQWMPPPPDYGYGYGYPPPNYGPGYGYPRPAYGYRPGYGPGPPLNYPYAAPEQTRPAPDYRKNSNQTQGRAPSRQQSAGEAANNTVSIAGMQFQPATIRIKAGETVAWNHADGMPHTVTSRTGKDFGSGRLQRGGSYQHTFTEPGTYDYFCSMHPSMVGQVVVE